MSEVLSNEEIESLMQMVNSGDAEFHDSIGKIGMDPLASTRVVSPVDLLKPNRISAERLRILERMFVTSAKPIGTTMSEQLRYAMHCDCVAVEEMRFASWLPLVGGAAVIYVLHAAPLETPLFFSVTKNLLYGWVDRVLGGAGQVSAVPDHFSEAEFAVADSVLSPIFRQLVASMAEVVELEVTIEDRFTELDQARILPPQDVVLATHFQAGSDLLLGDLRVAVAHTAIEPFLGRIRTGASRFIRAPGSLRDLVAARVQPVEVDASIELGTTRMPLREILQLQVGQIIRLDQKTSAPATASVAGVPKFEGRLGTVGSHLSFRIDTVLEERRGQVQ